MIPQDELTPSAAACRLLTPDDAARFLNVSRSWLDKSRVYGGGPRFCRIGRRIRYRLETLDAYAAANERAHTSQAAHPA